MRLPFLIPSAHTVITVALLLPFATGSAAGQFENFVTTAGDRLMDGDRELRFISVNVPNLHYLEDYLPFSGTNPWRLPDEFEIRDALTAVKQLGGKVARIYVFSVKRQDDGPEIIRHVEGPGQFNEEAFRTFDRVLQIANDVGVRLIVPFVDNWHWWGGPREYAAFRGKTRDDFWTDPELIDDFKKTVAFVINRTNTITGVPYKEDKAILAWETGNELQPPFSWTRDIASYVKSLDRNHLLLEGIMAKELSQEAIDDPNLDLLSTHHYGDPAASIRSIVANQEKVRGKKPYIVGEYGIVPTEDIRILTDTIICQGLAGGMIWSLRYRNREGGFYHHYEYNRIAAYRWPGFPSGGFYDERLVLSILREKAAQIGGTTAPRLPAPAPPVLLDIGNVAEISWQGSAGASSYLVERRGEQDTAWIVAGDGIDESRYQYRPLFNDTTAETGARYFYRVKARNETGISDPSNVVGPVNVTVKKIVDEMENFEMMFQKDGALQLLTYQDIRKAKEDRSRLTGPAGSYVVYRLPPTTTAITVDAVAPESGSEVHVSTSLDGSTFVDAAPRKDVATFGPNDYGFYPAITFRLDALPPGTSLVKIALDGTVQICRVEITYR